MAFLFDSIEQFCLTQGSDKTYWVAFSGGLDSHVLLHLLSNVRSLHPITLKAVHINHQLSPNASLWVEHCVHVCSGLQVELTVQVIDAQPVMSESPENMARKKRYAVLKELLHHHDMLVTAHQEDDQAETVLLQLLRGAGPKGLSAMPVIKSFGAGFHARPLLSFSRDCIKKYAIENQLQWIEDESNECLDFSRNYLRHEVIPLLKKRWPSLSETVSRVASHCSDTERLLTSFIHHDLNACEGDITGTLSVKTLLQYELNRQRHIVRAWLRKFHFTIPSTIKMQHIVQDVLHARADKTPCVKWSDNEVRRYRDHLYVMHRLPLHDANKMYEWDLKQALMIPGIGILQPSIVPAGLQSVTVRFRQGGEEILLQGHHHSLKKFFQEKNVPPWLRDRIPLIYDGEKLISVVGFF